MSAVSKVTFGLSCIASVGIIVWVHYKQVDDRAKMHRGVVRDLEIQEMRKRHNLQELNQQAILTQMLKEQEADKARMVQS